MRKFLLLLSALLLGSVFLSSPTALAEPMVFSFSFSGAPIAGEAGLESPEFFPAVNAIFTVNGNTMTLLLNYTGSSEILDAKNQALTGLTWDMSGISGDLIARTALIPTGSSLVGEGANAWTGGSDLSGQWAYQDGISAGSSATGPIGSYGVGVVGDINFGSDTFEDKDIIDPAKTLKSPAPNGIDFAIITALADPNAPTLNTKGPYVRNSMLFSFDFVNESNQPVLQNGITISNVQPMFGTDGAFPVPEPASMLLLGSGLIGLAVFGRKRFLKRP